MPIDYTKLVNLEDAKVGMNTEHAMIASNYSSSATYAVGAYAYYAGTLYKCTTAITTAEAWNSAHWAEAKLGNDLISQSEKIDDIMQWKAPSNGSHNRINPNTVQYGLMTNTGVVVTSDYWMYTDYIEVKPGETIYVSNNSSSYYCTYDKNFNVVAHTGNFTSPYTVPSGVYYIRATVDGTTVGKTAFISDINLYTPYRTVNEKLVELINTENRKSPLFGSSNRINPNTIKNGVVSKTGDVTVDDYWKYTDYIEVIPGEVLYANGHSASSFCMYGEDYNVVQNNNDWSNPFTVPSNVRYIRITLHGSAVGATAYVSNANKYTPYHTVQQVLQNSVRTLYENGGLQSVLAADRIGSFIGKEHTISHAISLTQYGDRYKTISDAVFYLDDDMFTWSADIWPLPKFVNCTFYSSGKSIVADGKYISHGMFINCVFSNCSLTKGANFVQSVRFIGCRFFGSADIIVTKNCSDIVFESCQGESDFTGAILKADSSSENYHMSIDKLVLSNCVFEGNTGSALIQLTNSGTISICNSYFESNEEGVLTASGTTDNDPELLISVRDSKFYECGDNSIFSIDSSYSNKQKVFALFDACIFGALSEMSLLDNDDIENYSVKNSIANNVIIP